MSSSNPRRSSLADTSPLRPRRESRVRFSAQLEPPTQAHPQPNDLDYFSSPTTNALDNLTQTAATSEYTLVEPYTSRRPLGSSVPAPAYTPSPSLDPYLQAHTTRNDSDEEDCSDYSEEEDANVEAWNRASPTGASAAGLADLKADASFNGYEIRDSAYPDDEKYADPNDPRLLATEYNDDTRSEEQKREDADRAAEEAELAMLSKMNYKERRKFRSKVKIEYNVTSKFLIKSGLRFSLHLCRLDQSPKVSSETCPRSHGVRVPVSQDRSTTYGVFQNTRSERRVCSYSRHHHLLLWCPGVKHFRDSFRQMHWRTSPWLPSRSTQHLSESRSRRDLCEDGY